MRPRLGVAALTRTLELAVRSLKIRPGCHSIVHRPASWTSGNSFCSVSSPKIATDRVTWNGTRAVAGVGGEAPPADVDELPELADGGETPADTVIVDPTSRAVAAWAASESRSYMRSYWFCCQAWKYTAATSSALGGAGVAVAAGGRTA